MCHSLAYLGGEFITSINIVLFISPALLYSLANLFLLVVDSTAGRTCACPSPFLESGYEIRKCVYKIEDNFGYNKTVHIDSIDAA